MDSESHENVFVYKKKGTPRVYCIGYYIERSGDYHLIDIDKGITSPRGMAGYMASIIFSSGFYTDINQKVFKSGEIDIGFDMPGELNSSSDSLNITEAYEFLSTLNDDYNRLKQKLNNRYPMVIPIQPVRRV